MNPRKFLNEYTLPAVDDWKADFLSKHKAVHALTQIDITVEHLHSTAGLPGRPGSYRASIRKDYPNLALTSDVHDNHKHVTLSRPALISRGQELGVDETLWDNGTTVWDGGKTQWDARLVIEEDNGSIHYVIDVITNGLIELAALLKIHGY